MSNVRVLQVSKYITLFTHLGTKEITTVRWVGLGQKSMYYLFPSTFAVTGGQNGALAFWASLSPLKIWVLHFPQQMAV